MSDNLTPEQRSYCMSRVKGKDTGLEVQLRSALHRRGLRFRKHVKKLPGSPDIVFPRFKAALFVHGCFWHRHGCKASTIPLTNRDYWLKKFDDNVARDRRYIKELLDNGWRVAIVWECVLKGKDAAPDTIARFIQEWLSLDLKFLSIPN